ncbi:hypothetical protein [Apibacter mensalis]|uniref:hypothetical protein n=1 Tax=Apibacter mensalis TaxID=1586267 RepID=UPI0026F24632|nr:hypothetical protein [Apibacter mensalis]
MEKEPLDQLKDFLYKDSIIEIFIPYYKSTDLQVDNDKAMDIIDHFILQHFSFFQKSNNITYIKNQKGETIEIWGKVFYINENDEIIKEKINTLIDFIKTIKTTIKEENILLKYKGSIYKI